MHLEDGKKNWFEKKNKTWQKPCSQTLLNLGKYNIILYII